MIKNNDLRLPAKYSALTAGELEHTEGGSALEQAWNTATAIVTGLASAGADVLGSVLKGEVSPLEALCSSFVYLAGNIVASIIWRLL